MALSELLIPTGQVRNGKASSHSRARGPLKDFGIGQSTPPTPPNREEWRPRYRGITLKGESQHPGAVQHRASWGSRYRARYFAAGDTNVDTGGEFHLPACLIVVRRSRADREAPRRPHPTVLAHEYLPCHSSPSPPSRSPKRPSASPTPPSPRAPSASASPTNSGRS